MVGMCDDDQTLYDILEVDPRVGQAAIRSAYRQLAVRWHPDKNVDSKREAEAKFKKVSLAYEVLSDKEKRAEYDQHLSHPEELRTLLESFESSEERQHPLAMFQLFFAGEDPFVKHFGRQSFGGDLFSSTEMD
ncbi:hypothetical protein NDN08_003085 [Rhodosorus marinus]|uniref:J domain-containing protein n=1 Tax=Rhodosorus marinus TaxID=101924 RepID=A0AAV8UZT0_9RHOD|nr:hypothetical protein NDN08_003085 [Rhodosorus marinus]